MQTDGLVFTPLDCASRPSPEVLNICDGLGIFDIVQIVISKVNTKRVCFFISEPIVYVKNVVNIDTKIGFYLLMGGVPYNLFNGAKCIPRRFPYEKPFFRYSVYTFLERLHYLVFS